LDDRLLDWWNATREPSVSRLDLLDDERGFSGLDLVGGKPIHGGGFGPATQQIQALIYWLFVNPSPVTHPDEGSEAKSIGAARVHRFPNDGATYLSAWSSYDAGAVLIPVPHVDDTLLGKGPGTFPDARAALHRATMACVDRVNLIWPAALSLAHGRE
jgi:hypothetical protein